MRVVVLPSDVGACGHYRLRWPAGAIREVRPGWTIEVYKPGDLKMGTGADGRLWAVYGLPEPDQIDLLVVQRVGSAAQVQLVEWIRRKGAAVVMDVDDAMWCIDPANTAYDSWNNPRGLTHWRRLDHAASAADLVTVTTEALARRYAKHGRAEVLPNVVPHEVTEGGIESVRDSFDATPTLGWAGFTATHPADLRVVGDAVQRVVADTGCRVRVVGDAAGAARDWGLPPESVEKMPPVGLGAPYFTALTALDIGLVPLRDTTFNRAKSSLKAVEFAASGLAVVASPTPANREAAKAIPMRLAGSPAEWYDALLDLVTHSTERTAMQAEARAAVASGWTFRARAETWAQAWERAHKRRQSM